MKRVIAMMLAITMGISCAACGAGGDQTDASSSTTAGTEVAGDENSGLSNETEDEISDDLAAIGDIDVDKNLLSVTITMPAEYTDSELTQADYDAAAAENDGIKSITLNNDGSVTYVVTKQYHQEMLQGVVDQYTEQNNEMIGSEDYPNITNIETNDDFTEFTVTTRSTELSLMESMSVLLFYVEGGMYGIVSGTTPDNVHVDFVNADTGEIISSADSSNMGE